MSSTVTVRLSQQEDNHCELKTLKFEDLKQQMNSGMERNEREDFQENTLRHDEVKIS